MVNVVFSVLVIVLVFFIDGVVCNKIIVFRISKGFFIIFFLIIKFVVR